MGWDNLYSMSMTRDQANAAANAAKTALNTAADTLFITNTDAIIAAAAAAGQFKISVWTMHNVDLQTVFNNYVNAGYIVYFPDYPTNLATNPSNLFGFQFQEIINNLLPAQLENLKNPLRMTISWAN